MPINISRAKLKVLLEDAVYTAVLICCLSGVYYLKSTDLSIPRNSARAIQSLIEKSDSMDATRYFSELTGLWYPVASTMPFNARPYGFSLKSALKAEPVEDGKFVLAMEGNIGDSSNSIDLGIVGREKAVANLSAIVWACGYKIANAKRITIDLVETDGRNDVEYKAEMTPTAAFPRKWNKYSDSELKTLVEKNMVVTADEATGYHWLYERK